MFDDLYTWSVFNEEKQFDFNGFLWVRDDGNILIDPVPMSAQDAAQLDELGGAALIVLTNRDHERDAMAFKQRTGAQFVAHEADAPLFELAVDRTVADGEEIVPDLRVLHLEHGKSPGEIALLWRSGTVAFIGDYVWGHPVGSLVLGAEPKVTEPAKAALQLRKLLALPQLDALLLGDGHSILQGARDALQAMLEARTDIYINRINLDEIPWWEMRSAPGDFGYTFKNIDPLIGARHLGYQVIRLDPGRKAFPLHFHYFEEELGVVLEGTCTMRTSRGNVALRKGDFVAFPPGPNGDHQYVNEGTEPCTMLLLSNVIPSDVSEYPDSNKVNLRGVRNIFRKDEAVDYWDREKW
jgi:uncharacterized cupin superfamily protein